MKTKRTNTKTLIEAMHILANDIRSEDGVANAAIYEAADRLEELQNQHRKDDDEYAKLWQMYGDLEAERDRLREMIGTALQVIPRRYEDLSPVKKSRVIRDVQAVLGTLQEDRDD